jgi:hypothetical protein
MDWKTPRLMRWRVSPSPSSAERLYHLFESVH